MEQPQPQLETELPTESCTDDTQKNKTAKNNNENCSHTADSMASIDSQKNKGWLTCMKKLTPIKVLIK